MRVRGLAWALASAVALASCSASEVEQESTNPASIVTTPDTEIEKSIKHETENSSQLLLLDPPPKSVPSLTMNGTVVPVLSQEWVNSEELVTQRPDSESADALPLIEFSEALSLTVSSATRPAAFEVYFFSDISASGEPVGKPRFIDCLEDSACVQVSASSGLLVELPLDMDTQVVVVFIDYALRMQEIDAAAVSGRSVNRATWGVMIERERP